MLACEMDLMLRVLIETGLLDIGRFRCGVTGMPDFEVHEMDVFAGLKFDSAVYDRAIFG